MRARLALVLLIMVTGIGGCSTPPPPTVTLLHFNDVYEIGPIEGGRIGGLARVASYVRQVKQTGSPVLVTLGGDYLSPSALATARIDGEPIAGEQMVDVLNGVGLDMAVLGNHEFDLGEPAFRARLEQSRFRMVTSNVTHADGSPFPNTEPFIVVLLTMGGRQITLGVIGVTIDSNRRPWVSYLPVIDSARAAIARMGPVDAIVALTHLTLAGDQALVAAVPEIDVALGGHEHENWLIHRGPNMTPIVKADANVRTVAKVTLAFPVGAARPEVSVHLQPITDAITPDPTVDATVTKWTDTAFDAFRRDGFTPDRTIAQLTEPLDGRESTVRNRPGNLTDVITAALDAEAGDVDVALMNGGSIRIDDELPVGPVTEYDVIRILPFGGNVVRLTMAGSLLARVLDVGVGNQGSGGYLHARGAIRQGDRWLVEGKSINPSLRYSVATTDFLMTGREVNLDFLTRLHPLVGDVTDLRDIRIALIEELSKRYPPQ
jgi:5'-nucleotidase